MAFEKRDNSGGLFRNERKTKEEHPNLTGKCMVGGVEYYFSGWTKARQNGEKWISIEFKLVSDKEPEKKDKPKSDFDDFKDDCPF